MKTVTKESWWKEYFPRYYLMAQEYLLTPERTAGEVEVLRRLFGEFACSRVLDAGCADGRILVPLSRAGFRVIGLDYSAESLGRLSETEPEAEIVKADWNDLPFRDESFDSVISIFSSFGYTDSTEDNVAPLGEYARILEPGGLLILDMPDGDYVREYLYVRKAHEMVTRGYIIRTVHRLSGPYIYSTQEISKKDSGEVEARFEIAMQLFSPREMAAHLGRAGFEVLELWGDLSTRAKRVEGSSRMVFVAGKKDGSGAQGAAG